MSDESAAAPSYDIVIVGGGPGGYATALRAAARGLRAAIVEADLVGGTCLHRGCIPSKALLHVAALADHLPQLGDLGLVTATGPLDVAAAGAYRDRIVGQMHRGLEGLLRTRNIDTIVGWATVVEPGTVQVEGPGGSTTVTATHLVIATGSTPVDLPGVEPDGVRVLRSDDALRLQRVPASAVVIGAGAVGVEFASLWRSLGAEVTVVEALDTVLPLEDPDSSKVLARAFARRGVTVRTSTAVAGIDVTGEGVTVRLADDSTVEAEQVLVAVGRRPATTRTGLAELGLLDERGFVKVDAHGRSALDRVWAVGDAIPTLALAHAAFAEGFVVADAIAGLDPTPVDHAMVPRVTYSTPEVASVGLTEPQARVAHGEIQCTTLPFSGNARAAIEGIAGHVKLVCAADGTLLGAHVVGPSATELIGELGLATSWQALASEVADVVHAHPTLSENMREAALAAAGLPFHTH